jgi:endonuclease/exonuclease/phosphatase family metal-dependent hydrolase
MRVVIATVFVFVAVTATEAPAVRQGGVPGPQAPRRPRVPAELSERLTHSPLADCADRDAPAAGARTRVRVVTWNIAAALSAPVGAIAGDLQAMQADVIALQEVDVGTRRTGFVDEPAVLATALGFQFAFAASIKWDGGDYGLAVLSRWPLTDVRRHRLSVIEPAEPRIVLEATVCAHGRPLRIFNHHADRRVASRAAGFKEFADLVRPALGRGILVLGDFNEYPDAPGVRVLIDAGLTDLGAGENANTTRNGRIDYVLADGPLARLTEAARVWPTDSSDHKAVLVDLEW